MDVTAGTKATATAAAAVMAGGIAVILYGVIRDDLSRSLGGACLTMTALTLIALIAIRKWTTDTGEERRILAAAQRETQSERTRYIAAQAALENELNRLIRDAAADRARGHVALNSEREAIHQQFEEKRAQLVCDTLAIAVGLVRGTTDDHARAENNVVIQFPTQQPEQTGERERSREHGVVGP